MKAGRLPAKVRDKFWDIVIAGGGAAGFFAAIAAAEQKEGLRILILEKGPNVLGKVQVSGGGRCNVTHNCFDPAALIKFYPRGGKALLGPFYTFGVGDTVEFFESRGVQLKVESDNRMFPVTDDAQTIIDCLISSAENAGVVIWRQSALESFSCNGSLPTKVRDRLWDIHLNNNRTIQAGKLLIATGSSNKIWQMLERLGHKIQPPVPSLFTFNIHDERIEGLAGVAVADAEVSVKGTKLRENGPLLITHWGMSGPGILKISAWGARILNEVSYNFEIMVNLVPGENQETMRLKLDHFRSLHPKRKATTSALFNIPSRWWKSILIYCGIKENQNWADLNKQQLNKLSGQLTNGIYRVEGKSTFKEEFVTCGGVDLGEVDFKTMQSKIVPQLYFAGEVLNIDAVTGGFNFQAAWTTGFIAGKAMAD